jgi:hypothetical protein
MSAGNGHAGTTTYVRADLPEIAAALTGEPHPARPDGGQAGTDLGKPRDRITRSRAPAAIAR